MAIHATPQWSRQMSGTIFSVCNHVLSVGGVTLLDPGLFRELHHELNIRPCSPMATDIFLGLQNG